MKETVFAQVSGIRGMALVFHDNILHYLGVHKTILLTPVLMRTFSFTVIKTTLD